MALILPALYLAACGDLDSARRRAQLGEIAEHLAVAYDRFDSRDYDGCIERCGRILELDSEYTVARELAEDAAKEKEREGRRLVERARVRDMAENLTRAYEHFRRREYDASLAFCAYIGSLEPEYAVTIEFTEDLLKVRERDEYYDFIMSKVNNWAKLTSTGEGSDIPYKAYYFPATMDH